MNAGFGLNFLVAGGLVLAAATTATAQEAAPAPLPASPFLATPVQTPAEALVQDARDYAVRHAVPFDEALKRLRAQEESVAATDRLRGAYAARLAGIVLEHRPVFRFVILLTGDVPVADSVIRAGGLDIPVHFRTGAAATREAVIAAIERDQDDIRRALGRLPALGHDPRTGSLVVATGSVEAARYRADGMEGKLAALTGVPVRMIALDGPDRNLAPEGGARLEGVDTASGQRLACTAGFVVTDGAQTGIVTAAHCPDSIAYIGPGRAETPLEFAGQWGWRYHDVQLHRSAVPLEPLFFSDTAKSQTRAVTSWRNRASTRAGDTVCHRGETTGYSCAEVEYPDFAPAGDLCGGPCAPTWVAVAGPTCRGGDSGAPVFSGTIAFGIVKGASYRRDGACNLYYYMSTDYLPEGWTLLYRR